jgi:hypothetical protein
MTTGGADPLQILDGLPDAVVVIDAEGRIEWLNAATERLAGSSRDAVIGLPVSEAFRIIDTSGRDLLSRSPAGRRTFGERTPEIDAELTVTEGRSMPVSIRCAYEKDQRGVVQRMICTIRPAAARVGADMRTAEVISTVSHEIRSPLTSVKGFTKTLLERWDRFDDDMKKEMLRAVDADADRVTRLLNELLDISRLESGRLKLRPAPVDLAGLAESVAGKLRGRAVRHILRVESSRRLPIVEADPDKIEQVLTNLIENAMKYTDGGEVTIGVRAARHAVSVSVSDQGEGIPAADLARLFRKFARRETPGSPSGTGLGLYISRRLIEAHGGQLTAKSTAGKGSVFTFTLPPDPAA